ncbi:unnamed protein product [Onchocerca ochengi]|uniref:G_PROTEIN_RECEP_F1_2 domain-containing protein n=1 Tax=Onchocerca ochengi TaxID=42157 RepID=A0A182E956_ONCOC|nr:unnamed protein product [Onchocerca ochengi]
MFPNTNAHLQCVDGSQYLGPQQRDVSRTGKFINHVVWLCHYLLLWSSGQLNISASVFQALLTCAAWTVIHFMALCIAGVHLLTFARIHYEQLFGLSPNMLCVLSWLLAFGLALPTITNGHIIIYDPSFRHCIWGDSDSGLKFLTYLLILGVFIPASLASYAYIRVLGILYHSPIVFQSIGLYKSRFLVYSFLFSPFYQLPFYAISIVKDWRKPDSTVPVVMLFLAFMQCFISPGLYGASLFLMKEEDMALTARAHKAPNAHPLTQHL